MSHFAYACKMRYPLATIDVVGENPNISEVLLNIFCIVIIQIMSG